MEGATSGVKSCRAGVKKARKLPLAFLAACGSTVSNL
jgi:hypothetical protein